MLQKCNLIIKLSLYSVTMINPLSVNTTNDQTHSNNSSRLLLTNCLGVFDHFMGLALKRFRKCLFLKIIITAYTSISPPMD